MKIFIAVIGTILGLLGTLFLYQNWTRTISVDAQGNALSFDLQFWGLVYSDELSVSVFTLAVLAIGILLGMALPSIFKILKSPV